MKKLFAGIISIIMVMSLGLTAFAAETITEENGSKQMDVQAKAVYINPDDVYTAPVSDGKASLTTAGGTVINITSNDLETDGMSFNFIEMLSTDTEAYSWISGIISGLCDKFTAYDIYFTDNDGNRVDMTGEVTVSITTPDGYTNLQAYHIDASAKTEEINSEQSGENTIFTAKGFGYYLLAEKTTDDGSSTTEPTKPANPDSPQTGDTSNMALWIALLLVSGGVVTALGVSKKRRKLNTK